MPPCTWMDSPTRKKKEKKYKKKKENDERERRRDESKKEIEQEHFYHPSHYNPKIMAYNTTNNSTKKSYKI